MMTKHRLTSTDPFLLCNNMGCSLQGLREREKGPRVDVDMDVDMVPN